MAKIKVTVRDEGSTKNLMSVTIIAAQMAHFLFELELLRSKVQNEFGKERDLLFHYHVDGKPPTGFKTFVKKDEATYVNYKMGSLAL